MAAAAIPATRTHVRDSMKTRPEATAIYAIAGVTTALFAVCLAAAVQSGAAALYLLAAVILGTAYDFGAAIAGARAPRADRSLVRYARLNFAALPFGIVFTPMAASFVIAELAPGGLNQQLAQSYPLLLAGALGFGALFLFAKYRRVDTGGATEYVLDHGHRYTATIFMLRRVILGLSMLIAVIAVYEGFGTSHAVWSALFLAAFAASVPLHILHLRIPSMLSELATLVILAWGSLRIFAG